MLSSGTVLLRCLGMPLLVFPPAPTPSPGTSSLLGTPARSPKGAGKADARPGQAQRGSLHDLLDRLLEAVRAGSATGWARWGRAQQLPIPQGPPPTGPASQSAGPLGKCGWGALVMSLALPQPGPHLPPLCPSQLQHLGQ